MAYAWRVRYYELTNNGVGFIKSKPELTTIFVTQSKRLDEIEDKKRVLHKNNEPYSFIEIIHAEFLGKCETLLP